MMNKRYFVSYSYEGSFNKTCFGNAVFTKRGLGFDFQEELKKQDPELKGVVMLFFTELKTGEFEYDK